MRWRRLFRSNHLGQLTEPDVAVLRELGIRAAFDFRGRNERAAGLCTIAEITVHSVPIEPSVMPALRALATRGQLTTDHALELMRESYRNYIRNYTPRFRALFQHVLNEDVPLVIHCTAGKDRTGVACALALHALDVADDVILEDYLLTNQLYRRETAAHPDLPADVVQTIGMVQASFLAAAFDAMRDDFGDVDTYLRDGLGIDDAARKTLQERYLTP